MHANIPDDLANAVRQIRSASASAHQPPPTHQNEVFQVPSRDPNRTIKIHVYRPPNPISPSPVLLNFHGSGFIIPMHGSDDAYALHIAQETPYTVLDVQYRLAPEDPFPAAPNDAEDVLKWVLSRPEEFDAERVSVSGFSAGGNLALGLAGHTFPPGIFRHVLVMYPPIDLYTTPGEKIAPDTSGNPIPAEIAEVFNACYAPSPPLDRKNPLISPGFIPGEKFPDNVLVITCALDTLCVEAEGLAEKLKAAGKRVVQRRMERCDHGWDKDVKPGTVQEKAKIEAYDLAVEMLKT
ncbi:esterase/lipase [Bimuria novae-zelandiae CBS 107.79]|uniref:Esterase/lipase n=1 Tax=Bimuria novae-zelandiae CBS 107.79 TaxID=1447943 RepID=A0A6A5UP90_9PLEO|nr:esterase/lipase [Bimuria novae-zelandiae CBS 107.79]